MAAELWGSSTLGLVRPLHSRRPEAHSRRARIAIDIPTRPPRQRCRCSRGLERCDSVAASLLLHAPRRARRLEIQDLRLRTRIMSVNCLTWCSSRTRLARIRGARVARTHAHFQLALTSGFRERTLSFKCCCSRGRLPIPAASSWRRSAAGLPRATSRCGDSNRCSAARLFREGSLGSLGTPRRARG